jgi:hypothetical protein
MPPQNAANRWRTPMTPASPWNPPGKPPKRSDRRYGTQRWRKLAKRIIQRDPWCFAMGCPNRSTHADHIQPTNPNMPDALFFSEWNLRGACYGHNRARAWGIDFDDEFGEGRPRNPFGFPRKPRIG